MVDRKALQRAWRDYWEHPEWSAKSIAQRNGIKYSRLFTMFRREGYTARRSAQVCHECRLNAKTCPGFQTVFCAECPCPPLCQEWACTDCALAAECACTNESLKPQGWHSAYTAHLKQKRRNKRARAMYRYAQATLDEPLEEI